MVITEYCNDLILERRLSIIESELNEEFLSEALDTSNDFILESVLLEGTTNRDMINMFRSDLSEFKKEFNAGKSALKTEEDKNIVINHFKKSISILDKLEDKLRKIDDFEVSSQILGSIVGIFLQIGVHLIVSTTAILYMKKQRDIAYNASKEYNNNVFNINMANLTNMVGSKVDTSEMYKNLDNAKDVIEKARKKNNTAGVISITSSVLSIIKTIKTFIQLRKNGGIADNTNAFRNYLIVLTRDYKNCVKGYIKLSGISLE